jgi:hypothetical protein
MKWSCGELIALPTKPPTGTDKKDRNRNARNIIEVIVDLKSIVKKIYL